jgi:hypothetical protein
MTDVPLPLCSRTLLGISYQLLTSHSISSQPTQSHLRIKVTLRLEVYRQSARLRAKPLETHDQCFFFLLNTCGYSPYVTLSLTREWICRLQLLLILASASRIQVSRTTWSREMLYNVSTIINFWMSGFSFMLYPQSCLSLSFFLFFQTNKDVFII